MKEKRKINTLEVVEYLMVGFFVVKVAIPAIKEMIEKLKKFIENTNQNLNFYYFYPPVYSKPSLPSKSQSYYNNTLDQLSFSPINENKLEKQEMGIRKSSELTIEPLTINSNKDDKTAKVDKEIKLKEYVKPPCIILITGWRGEGKSALGWKILEILNYASYPCYTYRVPENKKEFLPKWVGVIQNFNELPNNSVLLIDEASLFFFPRDLSIKKTKELTALITLSRQKNITLIIVTQQTRQVNLNLISMVDVIFFKNPGELFFERENLRDIIWKTREYFKRIPPSETKKFVYAFNVKEGKGEFFEFDLPEFWNEKISTLFDSLHDTDFILDKDKFIPPKLLSKEERNELIRKYKERNPEISIRKLAKMFNVSSGTVVNILKGYPYKK